MPRSSQYPLEVLLRHRDEKVDEATTALAKALRERDAMRDAKVQAESERRVAEALHVEARAREVEKLQRGELSVADLARAGEWETEARATMAAWDATLAGLTARLEAAHAAEVEARATLAKAKADRDVIAVDRDKFLERTERATREAEQELAEETWAAVRRRSEL